MTKTLAALAAAVLALALAGCADPPPPETPTANGETAPAEATAAQAYKACLLTPEGDDGEGTPAAQAIGGLARVQTQLGAETTQVIVAQAGDYARAIQQMVDASCTLVIGMGQGAADAFVAAAKTNPGVEFALLDASPDQLPTNLRPVLFRMHESGFLAGYLAAASSTSGKVGAFGGRSEPAVTIYLDGFAQGVAHYNEAKSGNVELLGWNQAEQNGTFVRSTTDPFNDPVAGRAAAQSLVDQGADVLLAVAGASGVGALELAVAEGDVKIIWTDTDGCQTQAAHCEQILTSVIKDRSAAVYELVKTDMEGRGAAGVFAANLRNGGTHLTTGQTNAELEAVARGIIDGTIKVTSDQAIG